MRMTTSCFIYGFLYSSVWCVLSILFGILMAVYTKRTEQLVVLSARADSDAETVFAKSDAMAVAHDDALLYKTVVDVLSVSDFHQDEV